LETSTPATVRLQVYSGTEQKHSSRDFSRSSSLETSTPATVRLQVYSGTEQKQSSRDFSRSSSLKTSTPATVRLQVYSGLEHKQSSRDFRKRHQRQQQSDYRYIQVLNISSPPGTSEKDISVSNSQTTGIFRY
jgi:hypothetical protein